MTPFFPGGKLGSHAFQPGSHPRWPIWGSVIHHTAGGHVLWKGRELVTSLSLACLNVKPIFLFFLCPLSASFPFPGSLLYSNNWAAFSPTRLPVQLLNRDIKSGATISLWPPFQSPPSAPVHLPSEVTMGHHHDSSVSVQWHDIHGTLSTVGQLAWSSVYRPFFPAPLSRWSLDPACSTWHTFKMATSRGFYSSSRIQSLFSLLFSASLLSYSEFNEGGKIKGRLWFAGWWRGCLFVSVGGATQRAFMWNVVFFFFFFFFF